MGDARVKTSLIRLWMLCLALAAPAAMAASKCPFIRPAGLSAQQVDSVVAGSYAQWLHKPAGDVDTRKTLKTLDGTDNAILTYSFGTLAIAQTLGFDAVKLFSDAAEAKGAKQPFDSMSIAEFQGLARTAYAQGRDEPPPMADDKTEYAVGGLAVRVPSTPAGDWRLIQCGADGVTFLRSTGVGNFAASLRDGSLSPYVSDAALLKEVANGLQGRIPPQFKVRPFLPTIVKGTSAPCADAALNADDAANGATLYLRVRICYLKRDNPNTWFVLFSETLPPGQRVDAAAAEAFIAATSPK